MARLPAYKLEVLRTVGKRLADGPTLDHERWAGRPRVLELDVLRWVTTHVTSLQWVGHAVYARPRTLSLADLRDDLPKRLRGDHELLLSVLRIGPVLSAEQATSAVSGLAAVRRWLDTSPLPLARKLLDWAA